MNTKTTGVFIVDDHPLVLDGLISMIGRLPDLEVRGAFSNSEALLSRLEIELPDVLLLDINLPDINGLEVCKIVTRLYPSIRILAITNYSDISFVKNIVRNGAVGFLLKNCSLEDLENGLQTVMNGQVYLPDEIQSQLISESFGAPIEGKNEPLLTRREKLVLRSIQNGFSDLVIAQDLCIPLRNIEAHVRHLMEKFDVSTREELVERIVTQDM